MTKTLIENEGSVRIAVTGIGCWYPGARNPKQLWENILARRQEFRRFANNRLPVKDYFDANPDTPDKIYTSKAAYIDGFNFDWIKKRIPKKAFDSTDIVQWLALEVAESALKDAGYTKNFMPRNRTGVIVGNSLTGEQSRGKFYAVTMAFCSKSTDCCCRR